MHEESKVDYFVMRREARFGDFTNYEVVKRIQSEDVAPVRHGHWIIECVRKYELSDGGTAYVPEYECSCCGFLTESYVRLDEPIMPEDADFPKYCEYCGARMDNNNEQSSRKG